jgi:phosphoserine phosphatase RsbU/P
VQETQGHIEERPPHTGGHEPVSAPPATPVVAALTAPLRHLAQLLIVRRGRYASAFENLIVVLIVLSIASIGIEAIPGLPDWALRALRIEEIVVVTVFSFEYLLRIVAAPQKLVFIFSFQGIVDLLAIAPFFIVGVDARWLRALRLLRLLRILKLQTHFLEATVATRTRELADKNAALEQAQAQLQAELDVARALQLAILPSTFPARTGCDGAAHMVPATTMCGDFYDFIELPDGRIGLVMADVSGHGVPAAFFMAVARTNLRDYAAQYPDPGSCLAHTNQALCGQNPMDLFVTVFYGVFDPNSGLLRYASGGHNPQYLRRTDCSVEALAATGGVVLGVVPDAEFADHTAQLRPGDRLLLYTDGVTEACNGAHEAYGEARLIAELEVHGGSAAAALVRRIGESVTRFTDGAAQSDDITVAVLAWGAP